MNKFENNHIVLITVLKETRKALHQQLAEMVSNLIDIESFSVEESIPKVFHSTLIVLPNKFTIETVIDFIGENCEVIIAKRTLNYENVDQLLFLPEGTQALYVNDNPETVYESIETMRQLGLNHIEYIPYYPGKTNIQMINLAITPGELKIIPNFVEKVINIGHRLIDITTIMSILERFHLMEEYGNHVSERYYRKIVDLTKNLAKAHRQLHQVIDGVGDGILAIDNKGRIVVFNEILENMLKIESKNAIGQPIDSIIDNIDLVTFILSNRQQESSIFVVNGLDVIVERLHINDQSIIVTFRNALKTIGIERKLRKEFVKKGYVAKYNFHDIVGISSTIQETKQIAKRLAKTDLTVLIEGESGTGKELFASAIHNASLRNSGPFLAVNFSALSDDLVESELFGYEDGAFTGAKKGGKMGLFEQANGGTIFLDEIGDISLKLQARLLRVLQEKEIMRVGGSQIIPIDVRIIAATNKDLLKMIRENVFREDLYHRLKVLFIHLPELRARRHDIELLAKHFVALSDRKVKIEQELIEELQGYPWYGNVRELKNTIDYMLAVRTGNQITKNDLPNQHYFQKSPQRETNSDPIERISPFNSGSIAIDEESLFILNLIMNYEENGKVIGRRIISEKSQEVEMKLTEAQVRHRLNFLKSRGYLQTKRGRAGISLTRKGWEILTTNFERNL
ncbi:sigma 54-interacting transcriptional regulator [Neobacillus massiliamazoniensis]|uniref:Putative sigma54 specific transcriptional regulator n=1 Tax=Neobacillus massiliamazoniensis TaxID=1499688 RepID=A0A0U1NQU7_9BACI|nr:sigma 54-interacting transcriptional regulator [Neobacillus massiliamazoniensis]CRK80404.1 putative sigma54 specific transcriptional regulator [Neobacillus massiliamazoniensis]